MQINRLNKTDTITPFLKWPGRKLRVIPQISMHLKWPDKYNTLVEPFLGSGAVFLNTDYKSYYLNDNNPDLINLYLYLIKDGEKFIKFCSKYFTENTNSSEIYYELRDKFNNTKSLKIKSAIFLYLNRHGYNGLCRYNSSGYYNVPFGRYKKVNLPSENMMKFYNKAKSVNVEIDCIDFKDCINKIKTNSVVYCDPPYLPISKTSSFTKYTYTDFDYSSQVELVELIRKLKENKSVISIISNHDLPITRELYHDARIVSFKVKRMISCLPEKRNDVKELLAIYNHE